MKSNSLSSVQLFATVWTIVHGILYARILEWVAFPFSRGSNSDLRHCRWILYQLSHKGRLPTGKVQEGDAKKIPIF